MSGKAGRKPGSGGPRPGSGRKRGSTRIGNFKFRDGSRVVTAEFFDEARKQLQALADAKDPAAFLTQFFRFAEHGYGRPGAALDIQIGGLDGGAIQHVVTLADGRVAAAAVAGLSGAGAAIDGEG